jgi:hypothetical protein
MSKIPLDMVNVKDTSIEIYARIVKAKGKQYECSVDIDFKDGNRVCTFSNEDQECVTHIMEEVKDMFTNNGNSDKDNNNKNIQEEKYESN